VLERGNRLVAVRVGAVQWGVHYCAIWCRVVCYLLL